MAESETETPTRKTPGTLLVIALSVLALVLANAAYTFFVSQRPPDRSDLRTVYGFECRKTEDRCECLAIGEPRGRSLSCGPEYTCCHFYEPATSWIAHGSGQQEASRCSCTKSPVENCKDRSGHRTVKGCP